MSERKFFRDVLSVANTNIFNTLIRFVIGVVIARSLGPEGKGLYAALLVVPNLIFSLTEMGIKRATVQHIGQKKYSPEDVIGVLLFFLVITSILGILICGAVYLLMDNPDITLPLVILVLMGIPPQLVTKYTNGIFIGQERYQISNFLRFLPLVLNLTGLFILLVVVKMYVFGALLSIFMAYSITALLSFRYVAQNHKLSLRFNGEIVKSLLQLGFVYALALFFVKLNFRIDIILLQYLAPLREVGIYHQGVTIAEGWQAPFAVGAVVLGRSANAMDQNQVNENVGKLFRLTLLLVVMAALVVIFISPVFIPLIYGARFLPSVQVTQFVVPAVVVVIMAKILASRIAGLQKTYLVITTTLPALIINIIFNILLIPRYGAMGAVIATNISYFFIAAGVLIIYARVTQRSFLDLLKYRRSDFESVPEIISIMKRKARRLLKR